MSHSGNEPAWDAIFKNRILIADELSQLASELPEARHQLRGLSRWFASSKEKDDALQRADVLPFCLALEVNDDSFASKDDLAYAIRNAYCSIGKDTATSRRLLEMMLYPLLVLMAFVALVLCFSMFVSPIFQTMFEEFGIELPALTKWVLGTAESIRQFWWLSLVIPFVLGVAFWFLNRVTASSRPANLNLVDQKLIRDRTALANWAWHLSHLLKLGLDESEAALIAGKSSGKSWIYQLSKSWNPARGANKANEPDANQSDSRPPVLEHQTFYPSQRYGLLNSVMALPNSTAKIELLKEVAYYYWDRTGNSSGWWIYWFNFVIFCAIIFFVFAAVISLFMPLIAIISGLTSVK